MRIIPQHVSGHVRATCMKFWELINVNFTCWLHVENVSEFILYLLPPQWYFEASPVQIRLPPPRHKTNTGRKTIGEFTCIRTRANAEKSLRGIVFRIFATFLGEFISVRIHAAPVFAPVRIWQIIYVPPLQKYYQQLFLFVELVMLGLPEKSVTWSPEK